VLANTASEPERAPRCEMGPKIVTSARPFCGDDQNTNSSIRDFYRRARYYYIGMFIKRI